jgi:predicted outer membrane protein
MLEALALMVMLADQGPTLPRQADPSAAPVPPTESRPTDPLYDRPREAADDASFVLTAVESVRQGVMDARAAESGLPTPELRSAAAKIGQQQEATLARLEAVSKQKGWRLPQGNPVRTGTVPVSSAARTSADFIINQIANHQSTLDQFRTQLAGKGDPELKRALQAAVPGYEKNLQMLLGLKL